MIIIISANGSGPLFDGGLELLPRYIAALEDHLAVDLDGGELRQGCPLEQAEGRLLDDLDVKDIVLLQLRDHGGDIVSPFPLRVVEVQFDQHDSFSLPKSDAPEQCMNNAAMS